MPAIKLRRGESCKMHRPAYGADRAVPGYTIELGAADLAPLPPRTGETLTTFSES